MLSEEEKAKCREISKKIVDEDHRLGANPNYGSKDPKVLFQANFQGLCAELAVSKLYPGTLPEAFNLNFSKPHYIGGADITVQPGFTIQVKSTSKYAESGIPVDPCRFGSERSWRFCDCTYAVYYRESDLQIVRSILLLDLKKCPEAGRFGRLLELPYEKFWKGRVER